MKEIEVTVRTVEFQTFRMEVEDDFDAAEATRVDVEEFFDSTFDWPEIASETDAWAVCEVKDPSRPVGQQITQY